MPHIGFGNMVDLDNVIALAMVSPGVNPVIRQSKLVLDITHGRKTKTAIFMDSGHIILSPFETETIIGRIDATYERFA